MLKGAGYESIGHICEIFIIIGAIIKVLSILHPLMSEAHVTKKV